MSVWGPDSLSSRSAGIGGRSLGNHAEPRRVLGPMKLLRMGLLCSLASLVLWLMACGAVRVIAAEWALHPGRRAAPGDALTIAIAQREGASFESASIVTADGLTLRGWGFRPTH